MGGELLICIEKVANLIKSDYFCNMNTLNCPRLAIVVPCYNEEEVLLSTNERLHSLLMQMIDEGDIASDSYIIYGDDGSKDSTWNKIMDIRRGDPRHIHGVRLATNSGHQNMLMALLSAVQNHCDISISIDADLQDDPETIIKMVEEYKKGSDVVMGVREERDTDTFFKRFSAQAYYKLMNAMGVNSVYNHADYRLMSSRAMEMLLAHDERNLYLRGIVSGMGVPKTTVGYRRSKREHGESKYTLGKMLNLAIDGITSFTIKPIRAVSLIGVIFIIISLCILIFVLSAYFKGETVPGWPSLMLSIWFCSGVILLSIGIVGEYIGKIYIETKHRPRYFVEENTLGT